MPQSHKHVENGCQVWTFSTHSHNSATDTFSLSWSLRHKNYVSRFWKSPTATWTWDTLHGPGLELSTPTVTFLWTSLICKLCHAVVRSSETVADVFAAEVYQNPLAFIQMPEGTFWSWMTCTSRATHTGGNEGMLSQAQLLGRMNSSVVI